MTFQTADEYEHDADECPQCSSLMKGCTCHVCGYKDCGGRHMGIACIVEENHDWKPTKFSKCQISEGRNYVYCKRCEKYAMVFMNGTMLIEAKLIEKECDVKECKKLSCKYHHNKWKQNKRKNGG